MSEYVLPGRGTWQNTEIVGEAHRERQISAVLGRKPKLDEQIEQEHPAHLVPEPDNPHDANAISIRIKNHVVVYLSRDDAANYAAALHRIAASGHTAVTSARIWATTSRSWTDERRVGFHSRITIYMPEPAQILPLNTRHSDVALLLPVSCLASSRTISAARLPAPWNRNSFHDEARRADETPCALLALLAARAGRHDTFSAHSRSSR